MGNTAHSYGQSLAGQHQQHRATQPPIELQLCLPNSPQTANLALRLQASSPAVFHTVSKPLCPQVQGSPPQWLLSLHSAQGSGH